MAAENEKIKKLKEEIKKREQRIKEIEAKEKAAKRKARNRIITKLGEAVATYITRDIADNDIELLKAFLKNHKEDFEKEMNTR